MIENAEDILKRQRQKAKERQKRWVERQKEQFGRKQWYFLMTEEEFNLVKEIVLQRRRERGEED